MSTGSENFPMGCSQNKIDPVRVILSKIKIRMTRKIYNLSGDGLAHIMIQHCNFSSQWIKTRTINLYRLYNDNPSHHFLLRWINTEKIRVMMGQAEEPNEGTHPFSFFSQRMEMIPFLTVSFINWKN